MFFKKKEQEKIKIYEFQGKIKDEYNIALKDKFMNMVKAYERLNIVLSNGISYEITPFFLAKEQDLNIMELFTIELIGYVEEEEIISFYESYYDIFLFLMNIQAKLNIPPTDEKNNFVENLEIKKNFCVLKSNNNKFYLIFSKKISEKLPFDINKINLDDCFFFNEIKNENVLFFIIKKFKIQDVNFKLSNNLSDTIYELQKEKITLKKEKIRIKTEFETNVLKKKRNLEELTVKNEEKDKIIEELKNQLLQFEKQEYQIQKLKEEKEELLIKFQTIKLIKKETTFNHKIYKSNVQEIFIPSQKENKESNDSNSYIKDIEPPTININEINNNDVDKYHCCICLENERNVFCKDCFHSSLCLDCMIGLILKQKNKKLSEEKIKEKFKKGNLKKKIKCPICKTETLCLPCIYS